MEKLSFIEFLDGFKSKQEVLNYEYLKFIQNVNADFYSNNYSNPQMVGYCPSIQETNKYNEWMQKNQVQLKIEDDRPEKFIDANINTISDLIKLIDNNHYDDDYKYNIDLQSLHKIKHELESLNNMVGLETIKTSILDQLLYFLQGLHNIGNGDYKHTILYGPPGTGKTEIAKILGQMYSKIGILKNNVFKKVTRSDLIAGYLGQTAIKTKKVIEECKGGVLFIDEVYSLGSQVDDDNYSKECIDTLCEALSDNKEDLMVIVAGYEKEIHERFLSRNSGLVSRFLWKFEMDKYTAIDMFTIFIRMVVANKWKYAETITEEWFEKHKEYLPAFGRDIEKLFSHSKVAYGRRSYGKKDIEKQVISLEDLNKGFDIFKSNKMKNNELPKYIRQTLYC